MNRCPECKSDVTPGSPFCGDCGCSLKNRGSACPTCGEPVDSEWIICPGCGAFIEEREPPNDAVGRDETDSACSETDGGTEDLAALAALVDDSNEPKIAPTPDERGEDASAQVDETCLPNRPDRHPNADGGRVGDVGSQPDDPPAAAQASRTQPAAPIGAETPSEPKNRSGKVIRLTLVAVVAAALGGLWYLLGSPIGSIGRQDEKKVVITAIKCNVRSSPTIVDGNILGTLDQGETGDLLDVKRVSNRNWYRIKADNGSGWVSSAVCAVIDESPADTGKADLFPFDLNKAYAEDYEDLYDGIGGRVERHDFDRLFQTRTAIQNAPEIYEKLKFLASPQSVAKQKTQHRDMIPVLVNDRTVDDGYALYLQQRDVFLSTFRQTKVAPNDIVAILNWESRLGRYKGQFPVFDTLTAQYFYIGDMERLLYQEGAYNQPGVTSRAEALGRVQKLKHRARMNLIELLVQSKQKGIDPKSIKGSWAGAIGIPQFMPASMKYAADGNGDGRIDLNTMPDAIMSIANYLKENGYHTKGRQTAVKRYNPDDVYVKGVLLYSEKAMKKGVNFQAN